MLKLSRALRGRLTSAPQQARVLHYDPTSLSRVREPIKEPQELGDFYKYRYNPNMAPETWGGLNYIHHEPYTLSVFYDWENYLPTEYNEHWSYAPMWAYFVFGLLYFWLFLYLFVRQQEAERRGLPDFRKVALAEHLPYFGVVAGEHY